MQLVDFTRKAVERIKDAAEDAQNVPKAFRDIQTTLPLLAITLSKTEEQVKSDRVDEETCKALRPVLAACAARMNELVEIFDQALPGENASRWKRGWKAISTLGKEKKVGEIARQISDLRSSLVHYHTAILDIRNYQTSSSTNRPSMNMKKVQEICLHSLAFPTMESRRQGIEEPAKETCNWVFGHPLYQQWNSRTELATTHGLLWIKGKPGSGKSTLMKRIVEIAEQGLSEFGTCISFFFSARGDGLERSMEGLYRSLTHQLVWKRRTLLTELALLANEKEVRYGRGNWKWHVKELMDFFHTSIAKAGYGPLTVFVDALDECKDDDVQQVVTAFHRSAVASITNGAILNICWSSRHYPHIRVEKSLVVCMEDQNAEDIITYVGNELGKISSIDWVLAREIIGKANGVFLWVRLVFRRILDAIDQGYPRGEVKHILEDLPSELDDIFRLILDSLNPRHQRRRATLFQFVMVARRPMTVEEMQCALAFSTVPPPRSVQSWISSDSYLDPHVAFPNLVREISGGLLEIQRIEKKDEDSNIGEYRIQFIHQSVRDFLQSSSSHNAFGVVCNNQIFQQGHQSLRNACLAYLSSREVVESRLKLAREVFSSPDMPYEFRMMTNTQAKAAQLEFMNYAVENWPIHARQAEYEGQSQADLIEKLAEPQFRDELNCWFNSTRTLLWLDDTITLDDMTVHTFGTKELLLFFSCAEGLTSCIRPLLQAGMNSFFRIQHRLIAWYAAAFSWGTMPFEKSDAFLELIENIPSGISSYPFAQDPLFHEILWCCNPEIIKVLLEKGFRADSRDVNGRTPTQMIVSCKLLRRFEDGDVEEKISMIKLLASSGADANIRNESGYSPLLLAMRYDPRPEIISTLIELGSNINASDSRGHTALHLVVEQTLGLKVPLETGLSNSYIFDDKHYFRRNPSYRRAYTLRRASAMEVILNAGADPNTQDQQGDTPLHLAINTIIQIREPVKLAGLEYDTYLEVREIMVRALVDSGADMTLKNHAGVAPIDLIRKLPEDIPSPVLRGINRSI